jgi:hypothetical protein
METPRKPLNKYWCSVPHYLSDIFYFTGKKYSIRLFRIISIPSKFCYFRPPDHVISMELLVSIYTTKTPIDMNCNMETPRKPLNKYWCSVPHYLSDIRNIFIKADRFPLMMMTAANKERKQI